MAHTTTAAFDTAVDASVNDMTSDILIGWLKTFDSDATFFELDVSELDSGDYLQGSGSDVTFFDAYNYEQENENVDSWSVTRVANQIPYGMFYAQSDLMLDNISMRYLPDFDPTIGAFIKSRRPVKIYSGIEGENLQQFVGFSDAPKSKILDRKTSIHAFDVMAYFDSVETANTYYSGMTFSEIIVDLLQELGFSSSQYSIEDSVQGDIGYFRTAGKSIGDIFREGCAAEQGLIFADEEGVITFWNRFHFAQNATVEKALSYENVKDYEYDETPIINHVITKAMPRSVRAEQYVSQSTDSVEIPAGETVTVTINFEDVNGEMPVVSAHTPVHADDVDGSNKSEYTTNTASDGTGSSSKANISMDSFSLIETTAFIVFTNSSGAAMYITDLQIWGEPAKVDLIIEQEYKDSTSISEYGTNPDNDGVAIVFESDLIITEDEAYAYSLNLVAEYKDGSQQLKVTPFADPSLKFGDVVSFFNDDTQEDGADPVNYVILGNKLSGGIQEIISQELILDRRIFVSNFTLDESALDGADVLAA